MFRSGAGIGVPTGSGVFSGDSGNRLFALGVLVFLFAKLYLVLVPTMVLDTPRLGDDSLVYLWKGLYSNLGYDNALPALQDIRSAHDAKNGASPELDTERVAIFRRVIGTQTPLYNLLTGAAFALGLDLKWTFAATEIVGVLAMTAGFAAFLRVLFGASAAGVGALLLAFAILPNQGIYSFIPSTFALSLALALWAYLLKARGNASPAIVIVASLIILGIHPVGMVYVAMAIAVHAIGLGSWPGVFQRRNLALYGSMTLAALIALSLQKIVPILVQPSLESLGNAGPHGGVKENLEAAWSLTKDPLTRKNLLLIGLFILGSVSFRKEIFDARVRLVFLMLCGMLGISVFHVLYGYPAELFSRLLVPFVVVAAGVGGKALCQAFQSGRLRKSALAGFSVGMVMSALLWAGSYVFQTINWRTEVIHDNLVAWNLNQLPEGSNILYGETRIALQALLPLGGYRFGAVVYPMIGDGAGLDRLVDERRPPVIVVPNYGALNSIAMERAKSFEPRRHGFHFGTVDELRVSASRVKPITDLYLLVDNPGEALDIPFVAEAEGREPKAIRKTINVSAGRRWLHVFSTSEGHLTKATFSLPEGGAWIIGVSGTAPFPHVDWPWASGLEIAYHFRGKPKDSVVNLDFSPAALLKTYKAEKLTSYVDDASPTLSDDSGLVFLRTSFQATLK